jgi:hypothetical protein
MRASLGLGFLRNLHILQQPRSMARVEQEIYQIRPYILHATGKRRFLLAFCLNIHIM